MLYPNVFFVSVSGALLKDGIEAFHNCVFLILISLISNVMGASFSYSPEISDYDS